MSLLTLSLILGGLAMGLSAGLWFVLAVRSGQLDDLEDVKFQLLREDDKP